ncbi:hypothetical protein LAZ67_11002019 [Cordylochernes scorpioides]|uniref:ATP-dependent DNA helicase n=1 Tax=Cordylochernes scorpioides TaxID=51811 RepID=A0ABY6KZK2_9ARAC|nr:hypothetical protein LAZ67_11002019 [Cordylochernes scorpioides]
MQEITNDANSPAGEGYENFAALDGIATKTPSIGAVKAQNIWEDILGNEDAENGHGYTVLQRNGLAERAIRDIKTILSCYPHFKGGWKNSLEAAVRYHNRSYNSYLGCSPLFKLTKTSPVVPADKELNLHCPLYETEKSHIEQNLYRQRTKFYFNSRKKALPPEMNIDDYILNPSDRPDLVARVFNLKLQQLLHEIVSQHVLGVVIARVHVVEFQKRGLPHAHMLFMLREEDKPRDRDAIDRLVCAEIPSPTMQVQLYDLLTEANNNGYPRYRRRDDGQTLVVGTHEVDNRWVVLYNPYLLVRFNAHINVEVCASVKSVKYLFKYVYKGHDRAEVEVSVGELDMESRAHDEIKNFLDARAVGKIVIPLASTGIAATLLSGGQTVHSRFKLPIPLLENSVAAISANSSEAELIRRSSLIIWDEAPMAHYRALEIVDRLLKDIMHCDLAFGGKNMRAGIDAQSFSQWLLKVGDGDLPTDQQGLISLPESCIFHGVDLVQEIFGSSYGDITALSQSVILTPKNTDSLEINETVLDRLPNRSQCFLSVDSVECENVEEQNNYPTEFLNSLTPTGMPPHRLNLKIGAIVMLLRNLNPKQGLCNGTRMVIQRMRSHVLEAQILTGTKVGQTVLVPKISLAPSDTNLPFILKRRQFPLRQKYYGLRPYHVENTGSRPITEVKQRRARSVLGRVTTWEHQVL